MTIFKGGNLLAYVYVLTKPIWGNKLAKQKQLNLQNITFRDVFIIAIGILALILFLLFISFVVVGDGTAQYQDTGWRKIFIPLLRFITI